MIQGSEQHDPVRMKALPRRRGDRNARCGALSYHDRASEHASERRPGDPTTSTSNTASRGEAVQDRS